MTSMMEARRRRDRHAGEAWIDAIGDVIDAEARICTMGLRYCRRAFVAMMGTASTVATTTADLATGTMTSAAEEVERTERSMEETMMDEMSRTARSSRRTRRAERRHEGHNGTATLPAEALDAFTVEQLDRLATSRNVEGYPQSGTKAEKADALAASQIDVEMLSVEMLDKLAEANDVDEYPRSGTKAEKIDALSEMIPELTARR